MSKSGKRWVTEYDVFMAYGGAEEGGWWYEVVEKVQSAKFSTSRSANEKAQRLNEPYEWERFHGHDHKLYRVESKKELGRDDNTNRPRPHYE